MSEPRKWRDWTQRDAIELARAVENVCPQHGCHVALTGGCLYKDGQRKDCDLLFYRIRQRDSIDMEGLFASLADLGILVRSGFGFVYKAEFMPILGDEIMAVDLLFPEDNGGEYGIDRE